MNVDANKRLVERFYDEVWGHGNVGFAREVFAEDYVRNDLRPTQAAPGAAGQARIAEQFRASLPLAGVRQARTRVPGAISLPQANGLSSRA